MSFTIAPKDKNGVVKWKWASGADILNESILPLYAKGVQRIVFFGTRTSVDSSTWAAYVDHVDNDGFDGMSAGCSIFRGATANPRVLEDGTPTNDVELHVDTRSNPWNEFYNETTSAWEQIKRVSDGSPMFSACAFAPLLEVPS